MSSHSRMEWTFGLRHLIAAICVAIVAAGCSGSHSAHPSRTTAAAARPGASGGSVRLTARELRMRAVVRAWSARLNAGDNAGIARLFSLPAIVGQGPYVYRLLTRRQVAIWHSGLPCSGTIVSITYRGRFATAVFRLGNRGATKCDQPGTLAAARFEIVRGKIASWVQVAVPPARPAPVGPVA